MYNFSITICQKLLLNNKDKSLNEYRLDFIKDSTDTKDPFKIVTLRRFLNANSMSTFISVLIKEFLIRRRNYPFHIGIHLNKNKQNQFHK